MPALPRTSPQRAPGKQTAAKRTTLDKAILASVLAMAAMNVFVLAQQLEPAPVLAAMAAPQEQRA